MAVQVAAADERWRGRGLALAAEVLSAAAPHALAVEHIGSTSIPGMAAKPVYDLQMRVAVIAAADLDGPLAGIGFTRGPYEHDHVPAGRPDAPDAWRKLFYFRDGPEPVNLHVRAAGSANERVALLFRDWLRAHPAAVAAYSAFKDVLAAEAGDLRGYTIVKDPVVDLVIVAAEEWAARTGWDVS